MQESTDFVLIPVYAGNSKKRHVITYAKVSPEDATWALAKKWRLINQYPATDINLGNGRWASEYMHRLILPGVGKLQIDHRDHCRLNNTRQNLRAVTSQVNNRNRLKSKKPMTSGYKGVSLNKLAKKKVWAASICVNYKRIFLGRHETEAAAALSYDVAAMAYFGSDAVLNFPG